MFQLKAEAAVVAGLGGGRQRGVQVNVDLRMAEWASSPVTRHLYSVIIHSPPPSEQTQEHIVKMFNN